MRVGIDAHKMKCTTVMFDGDSVTGSFDFQTTRRIYYASPLLWKITYVDHMKSTKLTEIVFFRKILGIFAYKHFIAVTQKHNHEYTHDRCSP
jgi:hypothetical protein